MKSAKPSTLKVPRRDGKSSIRRSKNVRLRGVSLNMESLEQRTLLSLSSSTDENLTGSAIPTSAVPTASSPWAIFRRAYRSQSQIGAPSRQSFLPHGDCQHVAAPATSHIYRGQPTTFHGSLTGTRRRHFGDSDDQSRPVQPEPARRSGHSARRRKRGIPQYWLADDSKSR